ELAPEVEPLRVVLDHAPDAAGLGRDGEGDLGRGGAEGGVLDEVGHPLVDGQLHDVQPELVEDPGEGVLLGPRGEERVELVHDGGEVVEGAYERGGRPGHGGGRVGGG